jgi:hypothetical protein
MWCNYCRKVTSAVDGKRKAEVSTPNSMGSSSDLLMDQLALLRSFSQADGVAQRKSYYQKTKGNSTNVDSSSGGSDGVFGSVDGSQSSSSNSSKRINRSSGDDHAFKSYTPVTVELLTQCWQSDFASKVPMLYYD